MVGEEGHEIKQARQLQVLLAGLLVTAPPLALLALPLQQTAQAAGCRQENAQRESSISCRRHPQQLVGVAFAFMQNKGKHADDSLRLEQAVVHNRAVLCYGPCINICWSALVFARV